jgi:hypothetical protein
MTIVRQTGIIIGKLGGVYLIGGRGQKRKGLGRGWRDDLGGGGVDKKKSGQGTGIRKAGLARQQRERGQVSNKLDGF